MKISHRKTGSGPTLVLLHGYAGSVLHWKAIVHELEKEFTVVVVNYGHFYLGRAALSFSAQVDHLAAWIMQTFPDEKVNLAGISFGGALVWGLGVKHSGLVGKTIFINPMPPRPMRYFAMKSMRFFFHIPMSRSAVFMFLSLRLGRKFLRRSAEIFRFQSEGETERLFSVTGKKKVFIAQLFNNFAWILRSEDWGRWEKLLSTWAHNSLMIYDSEDPLFRSEAYVDFTQKIGCKEVKTVDQGGHLAILGQPEKIVALMRSYLGDHKPTEDLIPSPLRIKKNNVA